MISFIPRVGKVQTGQSSGGFTAIIPFFFQNIHGNSPFQREMDRIQILNLRREIAQKLGIIEEFIKKKKVIN